jgi:hypothetical protein
MPYQERKTKRLSSKKNETKASRPKRFSLDNAEEEKRSDSDNAEEENKADSLINSPQTRFAYSSDVDGRRKGKAPNRWRYVDPKNVRATGERMGKKKHPGKNRQKSSAQELQERKASVADTMFDVTKTLSPKERVGTMALLTQHGSRNDAMELMAMRCEDGDEQSLDMREDEWKHTITISKSEWGDARKNFCTHGSLRPAMHDNSQT